MIPYREQHKPAPELKSNNLKGERSVWVLGQANAAPAWGYQHMLESRPVFTLYVRVFWLLMLEANP